MSRTLIDTSAWIEAMRKDGDSVVRSQVQGLLESGEAVLCDLVRLELWNGARGQAERRFLLDLEKDLERAPLDDEVWQTAIEFAQVCRDKGVTVPATDLLLLACSTLHGLELLHRDVHFEHASKAVASSQRRKAR